MEMRMLMEQFDHNARRKNKYKENEKERKRFKKLTMAQINEDAKEEMNTYASTGTMKTKGKVEKKI